MASLVTKGFFEWELNDQSALRLGLNFLGGNYNATSSYGGIIMVEDQTGSIIDMTNAGVNSDQQTLIQAYNAMYTRRRVAWIKLRFYPKYSEFPTQVDASGDILAAQNVPVYTVTDMHTFTTAWNSLTKSGILSNNTGVKVKLANKQFKLFRKGIKYPAYPKYIAPGPTMGNYIAGQWITSNHQNGHGATAGQVAAFADFDGQAFPSGEIMYEVQFEMKQVWCDREDAN